MTSLSEEWKGFALATVNVPFFRYWTWDLARLASDLETSISTPNGLVPPMMVD
jgi:hypothetical protein